MNLVTLIEFYNGKKGPFLFRCIKSCDGGCKIDLNWPTDNKNKMILIGKIKQK